MYETLASGTRLFSPNASSSAIAITQTATVTEAAQATNLALSFTTNDLPVRATNLSLPGVNAGVESHRSYSATVASSNESGWYAEQPAAEETRSVCRIAEVLATGGAPQSVITLDEFELLRRTAISLPLTLPTR